MADPKAARPWHPAKAEGSGTKMMPPAGPTSPLALGHQLQYTRMRTKPVASSTRTSANSAPPPGVMVNTRVDPSTIGVDALGPGDAASQRAIDPPSVLNETTNSRVNMLPLTATSASPAGTGSGATRAHAQVVAIASQREYQDHAHDPLAMATMSPASAPIAHRNNLERGLPGPMLAPFDRGCMADHTLSEGRRSARVVAFGLSGVGGAEEGASPSSASAHRDRHNIQSRLRPPPPSRRDRHARRVVPRADLALGAPPKPRRA